VRTDAAAALCVLSEGNDLKEAMVRRPWGGSSSEAPLPPGDPLPGQPGGAEVGCDPPLPHGWGWGALATATPLAGPADRAGVLEMLLDDASDKKTDAEKERLVVKRAKDGKTSGKVVGDGARKAPPFGKGPTTVLLECVYSLARAKEVTPPVGIRLPFARLAAACC
jgi:hypothetical protein